MNILIVDDDVDLCRMLSKYFAISGYDTESAYNGEDALALAASRQFDLIILDVMMPGMDGYEVCHRLKMHRKFNRIPILMLSAKSAEQDKIVGLTTGADAYLTKPFEITELHEAVEETVARCRRAEEQLGIRQSISFRFMSRYMYLEKVNELISQLFNRTPLGADEIWELKLALHEIGINAIEHGNKMDPEKAVQVTFSFYENRVEFEIQDEGEGFSPEKIPDPTLEDRLHNERGRGLYLVTQVVDEMFFEDNGAKVRFVRHFDRPRPGRAAQKPQN